MGSASSTLPDSITVEQAKEMAGDRFDEEKWNANKDDQGQVSKSTFLSWGDAPVAGGGVTKEQALAESNADKEAAEAAGIDWKSVHSCIRWAKPIDEVSTIILSPAHANCVDTGNGNYPIHIAAQNGHAELVKWLVTNGAKVNVQNGTGQTPLHMAISYDYGEVSDHLLASGANVEICNWDGNPAKFGIDGDKDPSDPIYLLDSCKTTEQALLALAAMEERCKTDAGSLDKSKVAMTGMQVKKGNKSLEKEMWTPECQAKFGEVMGML
ncbi:hypothetical protein TrVE_jg8064 [Triparma verrucosa]|uniref:Uncharacterized protein n=1 Tax=Triparma verrucosa TaxID=1606542 RepID=A0A9W7BK41_9STRA|nr:hypothetical protein TrVE_jg8064 [Triparma verrucosa]